MVDVLIDVHLQLLLKVLVMVACVLVVIAINRHDSE